MRRVYFEIYPIKLYTQLDGVTMFFSFKGKIFSLRTQVPIWLEKN